MAGRQAAEALGRLGKKFFEEAGAAFDQMFGQDGKNGLVTLTPREDRACEATDALGRWMVQKHLVWDKAKEPGVGDRRWADSKVGCFLGGQGQGSAGQPERGVQASGQASAAGVGQ